MAKLNICQDALYGMAAVIPPEPKALPPEGWKQKRRLVLASASARRRALLESMGLQFNIIISGVDEDSISAANVCELTAKLARLKAEAVMQKVSNAIIIGADSLVEFGGNCIGKPGTKDEAKELLKCLSGKSHTAHTGICVLDAKTGNSFTENLHSVLEFNHLSKEQIENWVEESNVLDLAGGYYIYEIIERGFVKRIRNAGADNVAGLPRIKLKEMLGSLGFY
jgi:septum formation protein